MRSTEIIEKNEFIEGKDYVVIDGEKFFTKEAIAIKYGIAEGTVNNKVRDYHIRKTTVLGNTLFHDDPHFSPKSRTYTKGTFGNGHDEKRFKQMSYNTLVSEVQKLVDGNKFLNQQNVQVQHKLDEVKSMVTDILDHLTKKKVDTIDQLDK